MYEIAILDNGIKTSRNGELEWIPEDKREQFDTKQKFEERLNELVG